MSNIFDLSKINGINGAKEKDPQESLAGYTMLSPEEWAGIRSGSLIRYQRKDGTFRKGGIVKEVANDDMIRITISPKYGYGNSWTISEKNIENIWIKRGPELASKKKEHDGHESQIKELKDAIKELREDNKKITAKLLKHEDQMLAIVKHLKKIK
jgi:hypothetical protein